MKLIAALFTFAISSFLAAAPLSAQSLQAPAFALNQPLPNTIVQVIEYKPPFSMTPRKTTLPKALGSLPAVLVYVIPGHAAAEAAALEAIKASKSWKKTKLAIVMRGMTDAEISAGSKWVEANQIGAPVIIDTSMEVALGLQALQVPSFAVVDSDGKLKLRKFDALSKRAHSGESLSELVAAADAGKPFPVSDGMMREDTRTMVGKKVEKVTLEPAPYSQAKSPVDVGPNVRQRPTLIVFWMATCPHCQREMPRIHKWWTKNKSAVELVTVTRSDSDQIRTYTTGYLTKQGITDMPVYAATPDVYTNFKVEGIPTWAMLHPNGSIVAAHVGEDSKIEQSLDTALALAAKK